MGDEQSPPTWPQCRPGQASTLCSGEAESATTILSRRSRTARTCARGNGCQGALQVPAGAARHEDYLHSGRRQHDAAVDHNGSACLAAEAELPYAPALVIVPDHDLHAGQPDLTMPCRPVTGDGQGP